MSEIELKAREILAAQYERIGNHNAASDARRGLYQPEIAAVVAALAPQWQAIESAPKDGSACIGFSPGVGCPILIRWIAPQDFMTTGECELVMNVETEAEIESAEAWLETPAWFYADFAAGDILAEDCQPTHWQPLPAPPEVEG